MHRSNWRAFSLAVAGLFALLTTALLINAPWAVNSWPWPEPRITFIFLASITAAVAAAWFAVAMADEPAALTGIALNVIITASGVGAYLAWLVTTGKMGPPTPIRVGLGLAVASLAFGLWLWLATRHLPLRDPRALDPLDRWAFVAFVLTLLVAGVPLVAQVQVFPWRFAPPSATVAGWIFLGAAGYFSHAAVLNRWAYAAPPYLGFLVYDMVLFVPYGRMFLPGSEPNLADDYGTGAGVNTFSLVIYMTVLAVSTLLALHALLVRPKTRLFPPRSAVALSE